MKPVTRSSSKLALLAALRFAQGPSRADRRHLVWKLLHDDRAVIGLGTTPSPTARRASSARANISIASSRSGEGAVGTDLVGEWLPPLSAKDERLQRMREAYGRLRA